MNLAQVQGLSEVEPIAEDLKERLQTEESNLIRLVEACQAVKDSREWSTLKTQLFDSLASRLERELKEEARKEDVNPCRLNRIAGELKWAERYSDLSKLEETYRLQLQSIRKRLHG